MYKSLLEPSDLGEFGWWEAIPSQPSHTGAWLSLKGSFIFNVVNLFPQLLVDPISDSTS